ncbi:MAG: 23S rRNA (guanosine(2251)-2'-O)-methyltransferase RlmB [Spirochaetaceae bacterium]
MERMVSGLHAIEEVLKRGNVSGTLLVEKRNKRIEGIIQLAEKEGCRVRQVSRREIEEASPGHGAKDALLIKDEKREEQEKGRDLKEFVKTMSKGGDSQSLVILLDGITDPHNVGAVLRSCDLFGVDLVVIPSRRSAKVNETVQRTSAGAGFYVPVAVETNMRRAVTELKKAGYWIFAADVHGEAPWHIDMKGRLAIVLGSEDRGVRRIVKEECDGAVSIPTRGHVDSFNVSVAAGILMYEYCRQMKAEIKTIEKG